MNTKIKKILSFVLSIAILLSISTVAFAEDKTSAIKVNSFSEAEQLLEDDEIYPTIIIHGMGQAQSFLVDENGERVYDILGKPVTGWPLYFDVPALVLKLIAPLILSICTQCDAGLSNAAYEAVYEQMNRIGYDENCNPNNTFQLVEYQGRAVSECNEEEKAWIYDQVPLEKFTAKVGEKNLYYFAYDTFGDTYTIVDRLEAIIEKAKRETGKDKVNLVPISLGGAISVAYVGEHPQGEGINKIVHIVPAADGSEIVGKVMLGEIDYTNEGLYRDMFTKLIGTDDYTGWLVNIALRILPKRVYIDLLKNIAAGLSDGALSKVTNMWGLVPGSMFDTLAEKYLVPGTLFAQRVYKFREAQKNYIANLKNYEKNGVEVYDLCGYGLELYSLIASDCNSDKIIHSASTSLGATFSKVNHTLDENYEQQAYKEYNLISPDRQVDASTCAFPLRTWFFGGQNHESLARNDVVISLATTILIHKSMNVYSTPDYPQFNGHRDISDLKDYLAQAKAVDASALTEEQAEKLNKAINDAEYNLNLTILVDGDTEKATQQLLDVLIELGLREEESKTVNNILLFIFKNASELIYKFFGPRGFSDPISEINNNQLLFD
ncbi:MAG: hypothetical protein KBT46_07675 [Ruminococcus sp.]|nr:hypothetical protein [Candidatus Copronaster equi]